MTDLNYERGISQSSQEFYVTQANAFKKRRGKRKHIR